MPGEDELYEMCNVTPTFGIVPADDRRFQGGYVDARGVRHDPVAHEKGCPIGELGAAVRCRPLSTTEPGGGRVGTGPGFPCPTPLDGA